jgi:CelD/BcsL family acetyltransferase involved in cellulose biosynthesis
MAAHSVDIVAGESELDALREGWDELAVAARRPFCAPGWMLPWFRHIGGSGTARVLAVSDGGRLVGIVPLWTARGGARSAAYEALTGSLSPPSGPIFAPGTEAEAARVATTALSELSPAPLWLRFWDLAESGPTATLLAGWGGKAPWSVSTASAAAPFISLEGHEDHEAWFGTKSSKFRQESRRSRRRIEEQGAVFGVATGAGVAIAIAAFIDLHTRRWEGRGGSSALVPGLREFLEAAATELVPTGRMRLYTITVEGRIVAANVVVAAGGEVGGWSSGFDPEWSRYSPSTLLTLYALADVAARGEDRFSLGPGEGDYKRRLADGEDRIATTTIVPRGPRYALARARLAPYQGRFAISARLSKSTKADLRRRLGRLGR